MGGPNVGWVTHKVGVHPLHSQRQNSPKYADTTSFVVTAVTTNLVVTAIGLILAQQKDNLCNRVVG